MAIAARLVTRPDADLLPASGAIATALVDVTGILSLAVSGGNRGWFWPRALLDDELATFVPGTIPIFDGHNATDHPAPIVGAIDSLTSCLEGFRFGGGITLAMARRLRCGGAAVSAELRAPTSRPGAARMRGTIELADDVGLAPGRLIGVAILGANERPARHGSCLWIATDDPVFFEAIQGSRSRLPARNGARIGPICVDTQVFEEDRSGRGRSAPPPAREPNLMPIAGVLATQLNTAAVRPKGLYLS